MELWFSGNGLVLSLAAALAIFAWYLSPALASAWSVEQRWVTFALVGGAILAPFFVGSARLDTFRRAIEQRPMMSAALLVALVATVVAAAVQRTNTGRLRVGTVWALLIILAVTAFPEGGLAWDPEGLERCFVVDTSPGNTPLYDDFPNVVLYLPAGLLLMTLTGYALRTLIALVVVALAIELYQAVFTERSCQVTDAAANVVGALIGVGLAQAVRAFTRGEGSHDLRGADQSKL